MKFALVQPHWDFAGSTYFGCPDTHLPLELFFARQQLLATGHEVLLLDAHLEALTQDEAARRLAAYTPDVIVLTTAPTYLFWRCPQPELRLPALWMRRLRRAAPRAATVAIGPHGSATPAAVLAKLDCDLVIQGEPDQILPRLASEAWETLPGCARRGPDGRACLQPGVNQSDMEALPALAWEAWRDYPFHLRQHRHHVFSGFGRGAEIEATRGCPWSCTFCNKTLFRNQFRQRRTAAVLAEAEGLARLGFDYVYFIDEIFGCGRRTPALLEGLAALPLQFGIQTRIDLWNEDSLAALGAAGCISLECGIESITAGGRERFRKGCRLENDRIESLLRTARRHIPWVQANLIAAADGDDADDPGAIDTWRRSLISHGIWASQPVPVFAFPGTPLYQRLFGPPDDLAWERAHEHYLASSQHRYSDIQDPEPEPLPALEAELEARPARHGEDSTPAAWREPATAPVAQSTPALPTPRPTNSPPPGS
jgi:B12-binding domain/radical SAM domain protein of rhizo-twelve system